MDLLKEQYQLSAVKHADETGWRNDGQSGYAWLFCSPETSLFPFQNTRSASLPRGIFGEKLLPGVLVVDRYNAYNKAPVSIQYCYTHLLRDVEKLAKDFPDNPEVHSYVSALIPLLAQAMHLRTQSLSDKKYYQQAKKIQKKIMEGSIKALLNIWPSGPCRTSLIPTNTYCIIGFGTGASLPIIT